MIILWTALLGATSSANLPPAHTGECRWVRGTFVIANGSSVRRISVAGTGRIIALYDGDETIPSEIEHYEAYATERVESGKPLVGKFYVCAREPSRPKHMQHVRLLRTRGLMLEGAGPFH